MKKTQQVMTVGAIALCSAWSSSSLAQEPPAAAAPLVEASAPPKRTDRIDRVVVFADRAEVQRVDRAACRDGTAAVIFPQLPDAVDGRTLRGEATGGAVVVGVSLQHTELVEHRDAAVAGLQKEIRAVDDEVTHLQREQADADDRLRSVLSYGPWFRTVIAEDLRKEKPDVGRFEQLLTTMSQAARNENDARVRRQAALRVLERRRERLQNRLDRLQPSSAPSSTTAVVAVQCGKEGRPEVRLSYVVPGARWNPEYDLHFRTKDGRRVGQGTASLTVGGVVTQSSGEDWGDVEVWLSTAKPRLGGEAPLPAPIYVNGAPEEKEKTLVQAQEERPDNLVAGGKSNGAAASAALEDGGKAFVLKLPSRVTVHADGRPYWFPVDEREVQATSAHVCVPSRSPWVYQVAALKNPAPYPLMAGVVHVFRAGTYIGDEPMPYRAPGESMELSLGIDEELALERQDLLPRRKTAQLLSSVQLVEQSWRVTLHNRSNGPVTVEIREQVPVTKTEDVKVAIAADKTTAGYTLDPVRGHLRWQVAMKRGATTSRDLFFTISLPKEWQVN